MSHNPLNPSDLRTVLEEMSHLSRTLRRFRPRQGLRLVPHPRELEELVRQMNLLSNNLSELESRLNPPPLLEPHNP